jgi:hypothetical protein
MTTTATGGTAKTLKNVVIRISPCCADTSKKKIEDTEGPGVTRRTDNTLENK